MRLHLYKATFVRPPISRFPLRPSFLKDYIFVKAQNLISRIAIVWSSKPSLFKRAQFKSDKAKLVPTAKALHRAMYDAVARGDKEALRQVCGVQLRQRFETAIDSRPPGRRYGWELVRYNKTLWRYPRIVDNKVAIPPLDVTTKDHRPPILRQVVVAIASRQRRVEYDYSKQGGGKVVPGSEKEVDVVENVVLNRTLDRDTFVPNADWVITALLGETTPEKWAEESELLKQYERATMAKKLRL
jgi:protein MBA1